MYLGCRPSTPKDVPFLGRSYGVLSNTGNPESLVVYKGVGEIPIFIIDFVTPYLPTSTLVSHHLKALDSLATDAHISTRRYSFEAPDYDVQDFPPPLYRYPRL
jgi:hypothetical protein